MPATAANAQLRCRTPVDALRCCRNTTSRLRWFAATRAAPTRPASRPDTSRRHNLAYCLRVAARRRVAGQSWRRIAQALDMPLALLGRHVRRHPSYFRRWRQHYRRLMLRQLLLQTRIDCLLVLRRHLRANDPKIALQAAQLLIRLELHRRQFRPKRGSQLSQPQQGLLPPERSRTQAPSPKPSRRLTVEPYRRVPSPRPIVTDADRRPPDSDGSLSSLNQMVRRLDRQQLLQLWERRFRRECRRRGITIPGVDLFDDAPDAASLDEKLRLRLERLAEPQLREKIRLALLGPWGDANGNDRGASDANVCDANRCEAGGCPWEGCDTHPSDTDASKLNATKVNVCEPVCDAADISISNADYDTDAGDAAVPDPTPADAADAPFAIPAAAPSE